MRFSARFLILAAALAVTAPVAGHAAPGQTARVTWRDWDRGLAEARTSGRPVLVDVYTDWCGWCRRMKAEVYARPEVRDYLDGHFVTVELDAEGAESARYEGRTFTSRALAARFGVTGYPTTIFLKPDGGHLVSVPGYVESARFMQVLRYIGDGHMTRGVTFQEFTKQSSPGGAVNR